MDMTDRKKLWERLQDTSRSLEACRQELSYLPLDEDDFTWLFEQVAEAQASMVAESVEHPTRWERFESLAELLQPITDHSLRGRIRYNRNFLKDR